MRLQLLGIGTDIVHFPRVRALIERRGEETLARRILSSTETTNWASLQTPCDREKYLAVRWAVKEAAYKALYPTFKPTWKQLSFGRTDGAKNRKPALVLIHDSPFHPVLHSSVSHDGEYVVAYVVAEFGEDV